MRNEDRAAYLDAVLARWREPFEDAEGDNMPELYEAARRSALDDDWHQLRPLLLVLRTMLRVNSVLAMQIAGGLRNSIEPSADLVTAEDVDELQRQLAAALGPLAKVLEATSTGEPDRPGAGRPRKPVRVHDPSTGDLRGLVAIPVVAGITALTVAGVGAGSLVQTSRLWWRGFTARWQ